MLYRTLTNTVATVYVHGTRRPEVTDDPVTLRRTSTCALRRWTSSKVLSTDMDAVCDPCRPVHTSGQVRCLKSLVVSVSAHVLSTQFTRTEGLERVLASTSSRSGLLSLFASESLRATTRRPYIPVYSGQCTPHNSIRHDQLQFIATHATHNDAGNSDFRFRFQRRETPDVAAFHVGKYPTA